MEVLGVEDPDEMSADELIETIRQESIDVLELQFRCEKEFRVRMDVNRMVDPATLGPLPDDKLTAEAVARLRERLPFLRTEGVRIGFAGRFVERPAQLRKCRPHHPRGTGRR